MSAPSSDATERTGALPSYLQPQVDDQRPPRDERDPPGEFLCGHCQQRFARASYRDLHTGRAHPDDLTPAEATAFDQARTDEEETLRRLRRHVIAGFAAFPVLLAYFANWIILVATDSNLAFGIMVSPGYVAFGAVVYGIVLSRLGLRAQRTDPPH